MSYLNPKYALLSLIIIVGSKGRLSFIGRLCYLFNFLHLFLKLIINYYKTKIKLNKKSFYINLN